MSDQDRNLRARLRRLLRGDANPYRAPIEREPPATPAPPPRRPASSIEKKQRPGQSPRAARPPRQREIIRGDVGDAERVLTPGGRVTAELWLVFAPDGLGERTPYLVGVYAHSPPGSNAGGGRACIIRLDERLAPRAAVLRSQRVVKILYTQATPRLPHSRATALARGMVEHIVEGRLVAEAPAGQEKPCEMRWRTFVNTHLLNWLISDEGPEAPENTNG